MRKRVPRTEQVEDTRRRLLDAAKKVFVQRGFHGATLDHVAEEAGFTKGAVYSRFGSKADLFLALFERHIEQRIAEIRAAAAQPTFEASRAALAREWPARMRKDLAWSMLVIEFRLHAARVPAVNKRYGELHARLRDVIAETVANGVRQAGQTYALDPQDGARTLIAFGTGAVLERAVEGEAFTDTLMEKTFGALGLDFLTSNAAPAIVAPRKRVKA